MLQNYGWPIIAEVVIIGKAMDMAADGGINRRAGFGPDINAQVKAARLIAGIK